MDKKIQTICALAGASALYVVCANLVLLGTLPFILGVCIFLFVIIPVVFRYSYTLQRSMLFLNFVRWPRSVNYSAPEKLGLNGTRNFYVTTNDNVHLGAWHVLPSSLINRSRDEDGGWFESSLGYGLPIILYMHGNSGSRAAPHRVELYNVLRELNYHVIAFDYRSYADSSPVEPSEPGLVADGEFMYHWVKQHAKGAPVFVWGHSLGTGISSHVLANLARQGTECLGLILESPFNNMRDEIRSHPFSQLFILLPWFEACFVQPMEENGLKFDSDDHVRHFKAPIMILHAEDDRVVPYSLGVKLYNAAKKTRSEDAGPVTLKSFKSELGYGHKYICRDPGLPETVRNFMEEAMRHPGNKSL